MKKNRNLKTILIAAYLTIPMALGAVPLTVSAAGSNTITINSVTGYTNSEIAAYKIFAGAYDSTNSNLTVTGWGNGISDPTTFIDELKGDSTYGSGSDNLFYGVTSANTDAAAVAVADIVAGFSSDQTNAEVFSKTALRNKATASGILSGNQITSLEDGYYVIQDKGTSSDGNSWSLGLLQIAGGTESTLNPKLGIPSAQKKVKENTQYTDNSGYNDIADYCIGDAVSFKITGTLPDNLTKYDKYYYCLTDTLDAGLDGPTDTDIVVTVGSTTITADGNCRISFDSATHKLKVSFEDIRSAVPGVSSSDKITVTYNAKLNSNAVIGLSGNESKVQLEYSNDPNEAYNPNPSDGTENKPTGKSQTPEDKVVVFTYQLDVTKVDGVTNAGLADAYFTLKNSLLKYATATDGKITGWVDSSASATKFKSGSDGKLNIIGLDDGSYTLDETAAPSGYNLLTSGINVLIDSTTANGDNWNGNAVDALTALKVSVNGNPATDGVLTNGIVSINVKNNKGTTLPTTGGMGTRMFYVLGGVLVIGSGTALVIKKRMDKEDK